ncbi:MAG TPA: Zn-ribbon domain-containing OB-fold protein [Acidimicrobiia bacterium]|nr:Zn-ribbon domain-containing OB-fold protein [Acidimicrobiia bacterium]
MSNQDPGAPPSRVPKPAPLVTEDSAVFWDAARAGRLVAQRCGSCGRLRHPPRPMCPDCHSLEVEVADLSGRGTVHSFAILHHPRHPAFDYPVLVALVDLDEGVRVVSNLVRIEPADVEIGLAVEVEFEARGDGAVPVFRPSAAGARA